MQEHWTVVAALNYWQLPSPIIVQPRQEFSTHPVGVRSLRTIRPQVLRFVSTDQIIQLWQTNFLSRKNKHSDKSKAVL